MLPTNTSVLENLKCLFYINEKCCVGDDNCTVINTKAIDGDSKRCLEIQELLDPTNLQKFMYSLHIVESLCKTKYTENCCGNIHVLNKFNTMKINKQKTSIHIKQQQQQQLQEGSNIDKMKEISEMDRNVVVEDGKNQFVNPEIEVDKKLLENIDEFQSSEEELKILSDLNFPWCEMFVKSGGLRHLFDIFNSGVLQTRIDDAGDNYNEWRNDCLATLLRVMCLLGIEMKHDDSVPKLTEQMLSMMNVKTTLRRISLILHDSSLPINPNQVRTGFWGRTQVIHYTMNILVCFLHSSEQARELLWSDSEYYQQWLQRLVLDDPEPAVRREVCSGLYRICLGNVKTCNELMGPLLSKLVDFLPIAEKMSSQNINLSLTDEGKEPYGPACRDYFWLIGRLVDTLPQDFMLKQNLDAGNSTSSCLLTLDVESLCRMVSKGILDRDFFETRHGNQDDGLVGLLTIMGNLVKYDPPFKFCNVSEEFIENIFNCLFDLPSSQDRLKPKCKSQTSRTGAYDLLIEMCRNSPKNYSLLHNKLMLQHRPGPHSPYPWDYWPRDDGRSECGYVGLTNLGATCYMASCIQHLYMMPQAREAVLSIPPQAAKKHATTLYELQRMFAYLLESERKSYNPRSFCRVYQMDHQPLNTGEQKDMAEFFIDLVSKLEEMTPELKTLVKRLFCGVLSNNVVSLVRI